MTTIFNEVHDNIISKAVKVSPTVRGTTIGPLAESTDLQNEINDMAEDISSEAYTSTPKRKKSPEISRLQNVKLYEPIRKTGISNALVTKLPQNCFNVGDAAARRLEEKAKLTEKIISIELAKLRIQYNEDRRKQLILREKSALENLQQFDDATETVGDIMAANRAVERSEKLRQNVEDAKKKSATILEQKKILLEIFNIRKKLLGEYKRCIDAKIPSLDKNKLDALTTQFLSSFMHSVEKAKMELLTENDVKSFDKLLRDVTEEVNNLIINKQRIIEETEKEKLRQEKIREEERMAAVRYEQEKIAASQREEEKLRTELLNEKLAEDTRQISRETPPPEYNTENSQLVDVGGESKSASETKESVALPSILADCFDRQSFQKFSRLSKKLEDVEKSLEEFLADPAKKAYRFSLQKAVTMPVNAISAVNGEHMLDKYKRLHMLLSGKTVVSCGTNVNALQHPLGIVFAQNLMAKLFVGQGYKALSNKSNTVFAVASILVNLWADFPEFGELVLAHFYRKCPYLAPVFLLRTEGQSDMEYYMSLGYECINGEIEKQDKFLSRMQGIMRLFAATLVCKPRGGKLPPLGLPEAWRWLAAILNLPPRPDICPALMLEMLKITGHDLSNAYRKQFTKMLIYIGKDYFPNLKKVTDNNFGGPLARLELFIEEVYKESKILPPADLLPSNFW